MKIYNDSTITKNPIYYESFDKKAPMYLDITSRISKESYCKRLQVGSIIVKDGNIISFGYNGNISGLPNQCEEETFDGDLITLKTVIHAESNAISKACKSPISTQDATMYCTHSCCIECAKLIIQSGISTFVYINDYRDDLGIKVLLSAGVYVIKATLKEDYPKLEIINQLIK